MVALLRHRTEWVGCSIKNSQKKVGRKNNFPVPSFSLQAADFIWGFFARASSRLSHFTIDISVICTSSGAPVASRQMSAMRFVCTEYSWMCHMCCSTKLNPHLLNRPQYIRKYRIRPAY